MTGSNSPQDNLATTTAKRIENLEDNLADIDEREQDALDKVNKHFDDVYQGDKNSAIDSTKDNYKSWRKEIEDKINELKNDYAEKLTELEQSDNEKLITDNKN